MCKSYRNQKNTNDLRAALCANKSEESSEQITRLCKDFEINPSDQKKLLLPGDIKKRSKLFGNTANESSD